MTVTQTYNEQALLLQVAAGDEAAFTRLFHHWQPFLTTHIYRITESKPLTEEIVQDVFLKIWQVRETLSEINSFKSYLLVVSKNHALNALRKMAREFAQWEQYVKENPASPDEGPGLKDIGYSLIDEAVDQLSPRQKEVYLLHRHQRLTYQQIADQLGIGRESVKTHLELAVAAISRHVKLKLAMSILLAMTLY